MQECAGIPMRAEHGLELFMHEGERIIKVGRALTNFRMPGKFVEHANHPITGYGPKEVTENDLVYTRMDARMDRVDVEVIRDGTKNNEIKSDMYYLTQAEFKQIKPKIRWYGR